MQLNNYERTIGPCTEGLVSYQKTLQEILNEFESSWDNLVNQEDDCLQRIATAINIFCRVILLPGIFAFISFAAIGAAVELAYFTFVEWLNKPILFEAKSDEIIVAPDNSFIALPHVIDQIIRWLDRDDTFSLSKVNSVFRKHIFKITFGNKLNDHFPVYEVLGFNYDLSLSYFQEFGNQLTNLSFESFHYSNIYRFLPYCSNITNLRIDCFSDYDVNSNNESGWFGFQRLVFPLIFSGILVNLTSLSVKIDVGYSKFYFSSISLLTNLEHLTLENFGLEESFAKALLKLTQMRSIRTSTIFKPYHDHEFSREFENEITRMTNLEAFSIYGPTFSDTFYQNLQACTKLIELSTEPEDIHSFSRMANLTNLTKLVILKFVVDKEPKHQELNDIEEITKLTNLHHLQINSVPVKHNIEKIANLSSLQFLDLSSSYDNFDINSLSSKIVSFIQLGNLTSLNVSDCQFNDLTPFVIEFSEYLNNLTDLNISKNKITNEGMWSLTKLTELKKLSMSHLTIPQDQELLKPLFSPLSNLQSLDISANNNMVRENLILAEELPSLTCLDIRDTWFGLSTREGNSIDEIAQLTNLTSLSISRIAQSESLDLIKNLKNLTFLYLDVASFDAHSQTDVIKFLLQCKKIRKLHLPFTYFFLNTPRKPGMEWLKDIDNLMAKLKNKYPNLQILECR